METDTKLFIVLIVLLIIISILVRGWIFDWDWKCIITDVCRIVKNG